MSDKPLVERLIAAHIATEKKQKVLKYPTDEASKRILAPFIPIGEKIKDLYRKAAETIKLPIKHKYPNVPQLIIDLLPKLHKSIYALKIATKATDTALFLVDYPANKIYQNCPDQSDCQINKWPVWDAKIVATFVAKHKESVIVEDILTDPRFPDGVGYEDETIKSVLCVPILTPDNDCLAVIQLIKYIGDAPFNDNDLKIATSITEWIGIAVQESQQKSDLQQRKNMNEHLLNQIKRYFTENLSTEIIITEIIKFAKMTLKAEHGQFFILDADTDELTAYLEGIDDNCILHKKTLKTRLDKNPGIVSLVVKTAKTINVKNATEDERFNRETNKKSEFLTKTILSMPIISDDKVLGVIQITNKKNRGFFTKRDEDLLKIIANYSTLILYYTESSVETKRMFHVNNVYLKLLRRQWQPCIHDIEYFKANQIVKPPMPHFETFDYYITPDLYTKMPQLCFYMCTKLIDPVYINQEKLMKFILSVRKLYRSDNPYHNFEHAFTVCHCMFNLLLRNATKFSLIELYAMIFDHLGYTNNFLRLINDDLAQLYENSILENHHYQLTLLLLNDYEIFYNLIGDDFKLFISDMKDVIIATDLILHFKTRNKLQQIINEGGFDFKQPYHKQKLKALMMNCCDLCGGCKPQSVAQRITDRLYEEFFRQGDEEKQMGKCPLSIMDRDQIRKMPEDQIQFLTIVIIPCADLLRTILPNTERMYENAVNLRKTWIELFETRDVKIWQQHSSLVQKQEDYK